MKLQPAVEVVAGAWSRAFRRVKFTFMIEASTYLSIVLLIVDYVFAAFVVLCLPLSTLNKLDYISLPSRGQQTPRTFGKSVQCAEETMW